MIENLHVCNGVQRAGIQVMSIGKSHNESQVKEPGTVRKGVKLKMSTVDGGSKRQGHAGVGRQGGLSS